MTTAFLHFFNLSVIAGWMVLAVLLLRLCLKKAPRWITCVLWGLVALRLLIPFTIESPVSLMPTAQTVVSTDDANASAPVVNSGMESIDKPLNDWLQTPVKPQVKPPVQSPLPPTSDTDTDPQPPPDPPVGDTNPQPTPDQPVEDTDPTPQPQVQNTPKQESTDTDTVSMSRMERILQIAGPVWLAGIGAMLLYELFSFLNVRRRVFDAVRLRDNVWQSDRVASPFIFGFFRPHIYVPYGLEEPVLEQVLAHERAHVHRRDHWIKPFAFTLLAVYWYNPLLWVGYILLCRDIEVACDERVVRGLDEDDRRQYATALLQCGVERRSIAACPLAFGEVSIKQRIKSVLSYRKPLLWVIIVSLVVCAVAAVCLLTVPKSKEKPKDPPVEEETLVVLNSKEVTPDQERLFYGTDTDGAIVPQGFEWLWEHAENPDAKTPDIEYEAETNIPLVVSYSKADLDELMDACSDETLQVDMRYWFELEKYDDTYFEDKVIVWLFVPGYDLSTYDYTIILEETNKGLQYAVTLQYDSTSTFDPWPGRCEYLLLFETDRKLIEKAESLTTRHEQAPYTLPTEDGLTMLTVGSADLDGDGGKEDIRLYHSELNWGTGWDSGYEIAYLVVCKADGTVLLREEIFSVEHSQCYLVPQEDNTSLLLLVEAGNMEYAYSDEEFGILSLKDGERTVLDHKYVSMNPVGWNGLNFGRLIPYVRTLSDWMEHAQLLYSCDNGDLHSGDGMGDASEYRPLSWLDVYRVDQEETTQDLLENILNSLNGETVSVGTMDFDGDGDMEQLSVVRYFDLDNTTYHRSALVVREADGSILTGMEIHYDYVVNETLGISSYVYRTKTENGYALKLARKYPYFEDLSVYNLSIDGSEYVEDMTMDKWLEYVETYDGELLFYFQGLEMYYPDDENAVDTDDYLAEDPDQYSVANYNTSILAYNAFLKGQRVAYEFGDFDTSFYVSDMYATVDTNGILRYALADVTGDGAPELITEGYSMSIFTYRSGRVLRLYETAAGMQRTLLSNGALWEERLGGGNNYRYTQFFEIGTTRTVCFADPGYDSDEDKYYVDNEWMSKSEFDTKTATYFMRKQSPALLIWYDYADKQPISQAMVQYLSLLDNRYQYKPNAYYALYDADGDGVEELLVKVGSEVVIGLPQSNPTLADENSVDWISFTEYPIYNVDLTFDGYTDIAVSTEESARGITFAILRWDTEQERLVKASATLINPSVDTAAQVIRTRQSGDGIVSYSIWKYDADTKDLVRTHNLYFEENPQATDDSDRMKLVVTGNGETKTLYVRGEPYALDKTDPQVASYYAPNSFWCLDSLQWENFVAPGVSDYAHILQRLHSDSDAEYAINDLDGDGSNELLVREGTVLTVYAHDQQSGMVRYLVEQDFQSGTSRFLLTGDKDYPGLVYFCVGGGKESYYYLSLDNVVDNTFVLTPLWTDNYAEFDIHEEGRITELTDDKRLIELSRAAYKESKDIPFITYNL